MRRLGHCSRKAGDIKLWAQGNSRNRVCGLPTAGVPAAYLVGPVGTAVVAIGAAAYWFRRRTA